MVSSFKFSKYILRMPQNVEINHVDFTVFCLYTIALKGMVEWDALSWKAGLIGRENEESREDVGRRT